MLRSFGQALAALARRIVPDPFVLAILLTAITFLLCTLLTDSSPEDLILLWGDDAGLWSLLTFGMQMCLILVTGHAVATAPLLRRMIHRGAAMPKTTAQAAALTAGVAIVASLLQWGLGLIVGALFARAIGEEARRTGRRIHYPLVGAAGYAGLLVWHGGFSGSAPIKVTRTGDLAEIAGESIADRLGSIPLQETIGSPLNLVVAGLLLLAIPALFALLAPREAGDAALPVEAAREAAAPPPAGGIASRLEESRVLAWGFGLLGLAYMGVYLGREGLGRLDPNPLNLLFLSVGIILHGSPRAYSAAVADGVRGCSGIILQFPLYAGIMGMLAGSGLAARLAQGMADVSTETTYPVLTFLSAAAVNLWVPSGGGQWAIQGPIVLESALQLGVAPGKAVMAFAYGDQWSNMIQPFWALALLGITGLKARDIIGYTAAVMLLSAPIFIVPLLLF